MKILLSIGFAVAASAQTLPDGPGKAITEKMCTPCHGLQNVIKARMTKERWAASVDDMVARGAEGSDDEIEQVVNYLVANFSAKKVNVNKAGAADLVSALGISAADAAKIVSYRSEKGNFKELQDVAKVPGINSKKIATLKDCIEF
jgi:competence protein ComEA